MDHSGNWISSGSTATVTWPVTSSTGYLHRFDESGELTQCSDASVIRDENGVDTGFRYCPHDDKVY